MIPSRHNSQSARTRLALPAKRCLAAALGTFLLCSTWAPQWTGWREWPGLALAQQPAATADQARRGIHEKLAAMKRGEMTVRDKENLARETPGWEAQPYEDTMSQVFHLARALRELDKSGQPPECIGEQDCGKVRRDLAIRTEQVVAKAEADALKLHGCDERARAYAAAETLALDVRFDPKPNLVSALWQRLGGVMQKEGACYRFGKYAAALNRHLQTLTDKSAPRTGKEEASRIALSIVAEYQRKGCWAAVVAGPEGKCMPAYSAEALARARASENADTIVAAYVEAVRLGAPEEFLRKEMFPLRNPGLR
jgi:hypothetical protein